MTIAKRLKEFRNTVHLTSTEVANTIGMPVRTVGGYERGEVLPNSKFYDLMIKKFDININWLISGRGNMFIKQGLPKGNDSIQKLQEEIQLSNDDMKTLVEMLKSKASRDMLLKFIEIKRGNKHALDSLISNLEGIKALF